MLENNKSNFYICPHCGEKVYIFDSIEENLKKEDINILSTDIYELYNKNILSSRAYVCLKRAGYNFLNELNEKINSLNDLLKIKNLGNKATKEVAGLLNKFFNTSY